MDSQYTAISRLKWQCRRGMLELDTLLLRFLNNGYQQLNEDDKQQFVKLLDTPDTELLEYLMGRLKHKEVRSQHVIEAIRSTPDN